MNNDTKITIDKIKKTKNIRKKKILNQMKKRKKSQINN